MKRKLAPEHDLVNAQFRSRLAYLEKKMAVLDAAVARLNKRASQRPKLEKAAAR